MSMQQVVRCPKCNAFFVEQSEEWNQDRGCCKQCSPHNKYGNRKTKVDGIKFDSQKESRHYQELLFRVRAGEIRDLILQPEFKLIVNGEPIATYTADFQYVEVASEKTVVIDVKSEATRRERAYRMKRKLMKALYKITIVEV